MASHILVAEDEPQISKMIRLSFEASGFCVQTASDGQEALEIVRDDPRLSMVLTDLAMPRMQGVELIRAARRTHPSLPIVVCSAHVGDNERRTLDDLGVASYVTKPFRLPELVAEVGQHIADHFYGPELTSFLAGRIPALLQDYDNQEQFTAERGFLKYNRQMLDRISATIEISSIDLLGYVTVSADAHWLERIANKSVRQGKQIEDELLWDAAGTLCNEVAGVVESEYYAARGVRGRLSPPTIVDGHQVRLRLPTARPSLALPFTGTDARNACHVVWHLVDSSLDESC